MLLKNCFDADGWMLLKHIYRVGRAANHQSNTDMENYENRPLNKPITAIMSQQMWKCITKSDIAWQNWTQNAVVESTDGIICKAEYFSTAAVSY